jgi:hypothetical protein
MRKYDPEKEHLSIDEEERGCTSANIKLELFSMRQKVSGKHRIVEL